MAKRLRSNWKQLESSWETMEKRLENRRKRGYRVEGAEKKSIIRKSRVENQIIAKKGKGFRV